MPNALDFKLPSPNRADSPDTAEIVPGFPRPHSQRRPRTVGVVEWRAGPPFKPQRQQRFVVRLSDGSQITRGHGWVVANAEAKSESSPTNLPSDDDAPLGTPAEADEARPPALAIPVSPDEENTTPPNALFSRPTPKSCLSSGKRARTPGSAVRWEPGVMEPPPSRERLHKQARKMSDAALDE